MIARSISILLAASLCACGAKPPALPASPAASPSTTAAHAAPPLGFEFDLPRIGVHVRSPCALTSLEGDHVEGRPDFEGVACQLDGQSFFVARYSNGGRGHKVDSQLFRLYKDTFKSVTHEAQLSRDGFRGIELEGTTKLGATWTRVFAIGDGFLVAQVTRPKGPLDEQRARVLLESLTFSVPWSVHSFPSGRLSVLLPDGAVRLDRKALHAESYAAAEGFMLGGSEARVFAVYVLPLSGEGDPEQRIELGKEGLVGAGARIVWEGPVSLEGARGRDFLLQAKSGWARARMLLTQTHLYLLQATASSKSCLLEASVTRFLDSLRYYPER